MSVYLTFWARQKNASGGQSVLLLSGPTSPQRHDDRSGLLRVETVGGSRQKPAGPNDNHHSISDRVAQPTLVVASVSNL